MLDADERFAGDQRLRLAARIRACTLKLLALRKARMSKRSWTPSASDHEGRERREPEAKSQVLRVGAAIQLPGEVDPDIADPSSNL